MLCVCGVCALTKAGSRSSLIQPLSFYTLADLHIWHILEFSFLSMKLTVTFSLPHVVDKCMWGNCHLRAGRHASGTSSMYHLRVNVKKASSVETPSEEVWKFRYAHARQGVNCIVYKPLTMRKSKEDQALPWWYIALSLNNTLISLR